MSAEDHIELTSKNAQPLEYPSPLKLDGEIEKVDEEVEGKTKNRFTTTGVFWRVVAGASIVFQIAAMIVAQSAIVFISGIIAMCIAPVTIKRLEDMEDADGFRRLLNDLRNEANRLHQVNVKITQNVNVLEDSVEKMRETEEELESVIKQQGSNVNSFVDLVKSNRAIMNEMKAVLQAKVLQDLMSIVLRSDTDGSFTFTEREMKILKLRMSQLEGVTVNENAFSHRLRKSSGEMASVMGIVKNLMSESSDEDEIFNISTDDSTSRKKLGSDQ